MSARLSASLVIVAPTSRVLFMLRPSRGSYRNTFVFPGGAQDDTDICAAHCALRETFEESGILIDPISLRSIVVRETSKRDYSAALQEYWSRDVNSVDWSHDAGLSRISKWTTPPQAGNKRFVTQFFLFSAPEEFEMSWFRRSSEAEEMRWISPADALSGSRRGEFPLFPPQVYILTLLERLGKSGAIAHAQNRDIRPRAISKKDGVVHFDWGESEEAHVKFVNGECVFVDFDPKL